jgi:hypothetical protein
MKSKLKKIVIIILVILSINFINEIGNALAFILTLIDSIIKEYSLVFFIVIIFLYRIYKDSREENEKLKQENKELEEIRKHSLVIYSAHKYEKDLQKEDLELYIEMLRFEKELREENDQE